MVDKKVPRMGIIPCGGNEYSFYLDDYKFSLMENQMQERSTDIAPQQGFLFGETYDHHKIGIYVGKHEFPLRGSHTWNTGAYVVSMSNTIDIDITNFTSIKFVGGTLNNLYRRNSLEYDLEKSDDDGIKIKYVNNSHRYTFKIGEEECYLTIGSSAKEKYGVEGISILDTGVYLTLEFTHGRAINFIFEHVAKIKELLSFLTFRNNVGFDEIYLLPEQKEEHFLGIGSQLFIQKNEEPLTAKSIFNNITFDDLGDAIVPLLEIIYNGADGKPAYSWGFFPDSDKKV